jgi:cold shock CspA family protein
MERQVGEVLSFNKNRGFGFILGADGKSHFLHAKYIQDHVVPSEGDQFSFVLRESTREAGLMEAHDVILVKRKSDRAAVAPKAVQS